MNKMLYILAASVACMATAPTAYATSKMYGKLGANMSSSTTINAASTVEAYGAKSGVMPEFTLGYDLGDGFAVELIHQKSGGSANKVIGIDGGGNAISAAVTGGDLIFTSTMIKGIYNIQTDNTDMYNPYVGFGIGKTNIKLDKITYAASSVIQNVDGSAASMQLTFGNRFKLDQGWFGDVAANYTHIKSATLTATNGNTAAFDSSKVTSISFAVGKTF